MATTKKPNTATAYKTLIEELKKGQIAPVYLLMGTESYYIDKICDWITNNLLTEEEKDFNLSVLYGSDVTTKSIINNAKRFPVMAERQVIIVREAQNLKELELFEKYIDNPMKTTVVILCYMSSPIDSRKKLVTRISQIGRVFISESPRYDNDIIAFIHEYISSPEYKATIDANAEVILAAHIGGDLKRMASELDKLLLAFAPGAPRRITAELIEQKIGISKNYNVFELKSAIIKKDAMKAHQIAKYFNDNPKSGGLFAVLPILFSFFQNLMICFYTPNRKSENAIMAQLGLKNTWATKDYMIAMDNYNARKTLDIISKIRETDARSKGLDNANTPPEELLKELISFMLL